MTKFNGAGPNGITPWSDSVGGILDKAKEEERNIKALCSTRQKVLCYVDIIRKIGNKETYDLATCKDSQHLKDKHGDCDTLNIFAADGTILAVTSEAIAAPQPKTDCDETTWYMDSTSYDKKDDPVNEAFCDKHYEVAGWYEKTVTAPWCPPDFSS